MTKTRLTSCIVLLLVLPASTALGQNESGTDVRLFGQAMLGFAGNVSEEAEVSDNQAGIPSGTTIDNEFDLDIAPGFGVGVDFGLIEYLALGAMFRFMSLSPDGGTADLTVLDFDALPRLRVPFRQGEVYLGVPVGLTSYIPEEGDSELGWNIAAVFGGLYRVSEQFGLFAELGYLVHMYSSTEEITITGFPPVEMSASMTISQIVLSIGAAYVE